MLNTANFEIQKIFISESTLKIHNTKHNSEPVNTDNPKLLLTIHNMPDYWAGGGSPLLFLGGRKPPREMM